jgi:hypothetical protein
MKYLHKEFSTLKKLITETNYAILNIDSEHFPATQSILVEPYYPDAENTLICFTDEQLPIALHKKEFQVIIKCINRKKGNYIRMTGIASFQNKSVKNAVLKSVLVVSILQMAWYYKHSGQVEFYQ